jgi:hypothetical protein
MAKPARQHCTLSVISGVVSDTSVQMVDDPDLQGRGDQVENETDHQRPRQPGIASLGLGGAPDKAPPDGEQRYRDEESDDWLG